MKGIIRSRKTVIAVLATLIMVLSGIFIFSRVFLQRIYAEDMPRIVRLTLERAVVDGEIRSIEGSRKLRVRFHA